MPGIMLNNQYGSHFGGLDEQSKPYMIGGRTFDRLPLSGVSQPPATTSTSFSPFKSTPNQVMYSAPAWDNQFLSSPQASMGGGMGNQTPLQTGAKINDYMDAQQPQGLDGLFGGFNPTMTGLNMLMNNQQSYSPTANDILGLFTGKY